MSNIVEMSPSDAGKGQGRLRRVRFRLLSALVLAVIVVGVVVQRGCSPQAREVTELRCVVNADELEESYEWYSLTNIFVLRRVRANAKPYSLNAQTGVKSEFEWLIPYVSKKDLKIDDWAILWPLQRLCVLSHTDGDRRVRVSSFDLNTHLEQHADAEETHQNYVYLPWRDSWASMIGSNQIESVRFYTAQKGIADIKPSPVRRGHILGWSEKLIFVLHQEYEKGFRGRLEIDALRLGDTVALEKQYTVLVDGLTYFDDASLSPDGKWLLVEGRVESSTMGFSNGFPFILLDRTQDALFSAINLETSSMIKILKRINPPFGATHTARWLPDGKSVSIIVDGELRVWKLFE